MPVVKTTAVAEMANAVEDIVAAQENLGTDDLLRRGWSLEDIAAHLPAALKLVAARAEKRVAA